MKDKNDLYNEIVDNLDFEDNKITNLNKQNNLRDYSLYVIPYKINEFEFIKNIHERINLHNWNDTRKEFLKNRYYYIGYTYDIKYVCTRCPQCAQKNRNFFKREPSKYILFNKPRDSYIMDITEIPLNLKDAINKKYTLNVIDHFSQLCKSYL